MTYPTPATQQQSTPPPTGHPHTRKSKIAAVTNVARRGINGATAHISFRRSLESVNKRIDEGKYSEARAILGDINKRLETKTLLNDSLIPVQYWLGLAHTHPVGSPKRTENAEKAYQALKLVSENNGDWKGFDTVKKSESYCNLRTCYERLKPLVPESETAILSDIDQKIAECTPHILPLQAFNAKVYEADRCVRQKNHVKAGTLYTEAHKLIEEQRERPFMIPKALCLVKHATICEAPDMKLDLSNTAKEILFHIYRTKESFFNPDLSNKTNVFKQLHSCFKELAKLFPETETDTHLEIQTLIEECEEEFTLEPPTPMPKKTQRKKKPASSTTDPTSIPSESTGPEKPLRKYTPGPADNGSWGIGRIFAVLVFAAVAVAASFVFYRRHIVKVD